MKKYTLIIIIAFIFIGFKSFSQKLEVNQTDEFTKKSIKRTSWESLVSNLTSNSHISFVKINEDARIDLKLMLDKVFSIDKDDQLMFKLDNGDFVKLACFEYKVTCEGCGAVGHQGSEAEGINVSYFISKEQLDQLKAHKIVKVRIYTTDGYIEDDVKDKNAQKLMTCANLI